MRVWTVAAMVAPTTTTTSPSGGTGTTNLWPYIIPAAGLIIAALITLRQRQREKNTAETIASQQQQIRELTEENQSLNSGKHRRKMGENRALKDTVDRQANQLEKKDQHIERLIAQVDHADGRSDSWQQKYGELKGKYDGLEQAYDELTRRPTFPDEVGKRRERRHPPTRLEPPGPHEGA